MLDYRVLYSDNGTLTDYSLEAKDSSFSFTMIADEDYIYIGQFYPFNNIFLTVNTANDTAASMNISYYTGTEWDSAVDVLDGTKSSGKTLAQSGIIRFNVNEDDSWQRVDNTADENSLGNLEDVEIYDQYWLRLKSSVDLDAVSLGEISYKFAESSFISSLDPDIDEYLEQWETGKSDWLDQILIASRRVVIDLKTKGFIKNAANVLKIDRELELLTAYKTLSVIYSGLGGDKFNTKKQDVENDYISILQGIKISVDKNKDGLLRDYEVDNTSGRTIR